MEQNGSPLAGKVALISGAARRVGAVIAETLHHQGMNLVLHYRSSKGEAHQIQERLNNLRENSVVLTQCDLLHTNKLPGLINSAQKVWGRLDVLINNASTFYPTPLGAVTEQQWDELLGSNLKAHFFLAQAATPALTAAHGCIVNITDIHAERPLKSYGVYSIAKAGLMMMTKSLARELGPHVRVNGVAPGAILWPENDIDEVTKQRIISRTTLKRKGSPEDVARAVLFLVKDADYISGETIIVDGGRRLSD